MQTPQRIPDHHRGIVEGREMTSGALSPTGYADPAYAATLVHVGQPRLLPRSRGSILVRRVHDTPYFDGRGPYPLFSCSDWSCLGADVDELRSDLISLVVVADPPHS